MAVYTVLEREDIETLIQPFGIGPLVDFEGVAMGIENTTYFLTTDQRDFASETRTAPLRDYVLTLFEQLPAATVDFYVDFIRLLSLRGLPVPAPITDSNGVAMKLLHDKPALIFPRAEGQHPRQPSIRQCREMGVTLAAIHRVALEFGGEHPAKRGLAWMQQTATALHGQVSASDRELLEEVPRFLSLIRHHQQLPKAVIHGDLFRDNALFNGERLSAVIDFFSAGTGYLLFDLAVLANDWCSTPDGGMDTERAEALLSGYQTERAVGADEKALWNDFLRIAATRFWLSRLAEQLIPEQHSSGALVEAKDPQEYRNILVQRIHSPQCWE